MTLAFVNKMDKIAIDRDAAIQKVRKQREAQFDFSTLEKKAKNKEHETMQAAKYKEI